MINGDEEDEEDEHHEVKRMVLARVLRLEPKIALQACAHTNSAGGYFLVCKQHPCWKTIPLTHFDGVPAHNELRLRWDVEMNSFVV